MRRPAVVTAAVCALAVVAMFAVSLVQRTELAFTPGITPTIPVAKLTTGAKVCQTPLVVPADGAFDRVVVSVAGGRDVALTLEDPDTGRERWSAPVDSSERAGLRTVTVDEVADGTRFAACISNRGSGTVEVFGNADAASRTSTALLDDTPTGLDMTVRFEREPRSMFSLIGAMFDRGALFKFGWAGPWTLWLLAAVVLIGVPALLVRALRGVEE